MTLDREKELQEKIHNLEKEIERLKRSVKKKEYGLVFMEIPEVFEDDVENKLPILKEVKDKAIVNDDGKPTHILIEGDNYHALTCLNYTHKEKIDIIYIDPPYNTGSDGFRYKDKRVLDKFPDGQEVPKDHPFRHSYWLSFMKKRLELCYNLLNSNGIFCSSIDDNEYPRLLILLEELFGQENIKTICVKMSEATGVKMTHVIRNGSFPKLKEYIVFASKNGIQGLKLSKIPKEKWDNEYKIILTNITEKEVEKIKTIRDNDDRTMTDINLCDELLGKIQYENLSNYCKQNNINKRDFEQFRIDSAWRIIRTVATTNSAKLLADKKRKKITGNFFSIVTTQNKLYFILKEYNEDSSQPRIKILFADDYLTTYQGDIWLDIKTTGLGNEGGVDFTNGKKPLSLLEKIISLKEKKELTILDFFAGSGTTLEAIINKNEGDKGSRQCILVTNNENNICTDVCVPRIKNVINGYNNKSGKGNSLKFYKTDFVGKNKITLSTDLDAIELAHNAGGLLALAENTLYEIEEKTNDFFQFFENKMEPQQYTAVYFKEKMDKFDDFKTEVSLLNQQTTVYIFSWGEISEFASEFEPFKHVILKTIPVPILEIYKSIYNLEEEC